MKLGRILSLVLTMALLLTLGSPALAQAPTEVTMMLIALGPVPAGVQQVEDAINEISVPQIGVKVDLQLNSVAEYAQQMGLMITSGEKLDLVLTIPMGSGQFRTMVASNQLADITTLLDEHGQGLMAELDKVSSNMLAGTTVNGAVRGVTSLYNKVSNVYWLVRGDILEKHGLSLDGVKTVADMEVILKTIAEKEPGMIPMAGSSGGNVFTLANVYLPEDLSNVVYYDSLGDSTTRMGVAFFNDIHKVVNNFASPEYKAALDVVRRWYQAGLIDKDAATTQDTAETRAAAGNVFSWLSESESGVEANKTAQVGYPIKALKLSSGSISTTQLTKFVWGVPATSREPEAAVKLLNLIYTDPKVANLLAWGIEGRDYVVKDGIASYPEGVTAQNAPYHLADFLVGNQFNVLPWVGNPVDFRDKVREENLNAPKSELLGYAYDPENVTNELSAITNVLAEFRPGLESGVSDPDEYLPKFLKALNDAGAETIIADMQAQLDAWLAAK